MQEASGATNGLPGGEPLPFHGLELALVKGLKDPEDRGWSTQPSPHIQSLRNIDMIKTLGNVYFGTEETRPLQGRMQFLMSRRRASRFEATH